MNKLRIYITIIACLLITVISIIQNYSLYQLSFTLIITIIVFYIIGSILEIYLKKKVFIYDKIDEETLAEADDEGENL